MNIEQRLIGLLRFRDFLSSEQEKNPRRVLFTLWVAMLILNGTYLRVRPSTSLEADWLGMRIHTSRF